LARARYLPNERITANEELFRIANNSLLSNFFMHMAKDLDVIEPRTYETVCRVHSEEKGNIDSAKANLA
jgi:26S proteasome regulatory subunit N1